MAFRLTISRQVTAFGAVVAVGFVAIVATNHFALDRLKVGGPAYREIKLGHDLVADVLPPPVGVIEAFLETTLMLQDSAGLFKRKERLVQLKTEYESRHQFWSSADIDPSTKALLVDKSDREVKRFWNVVEREFLPAIELGKKDDIAKAYADITSTYLAHRQMIDDVVKRATANNLAIEADVASIEWNVTFVLWAVSCLVLLTVGAGVIGVGIGVVRPVVKMTDTMRNLAAGALETEVTSTERKDEIGEMARTVEVFKANAVRVKSLERKQAVLTQEAAATRQSALEKVAHDLEEAIGTVAKDVSAASFEIEDAAIKLAESANATQTLSADVAAASQQASSSVSSAAAASEELAASVVEIGRQVAEAKRISITAVSQAEITNQRVTRLSETGERIGKVVEMIKAVAEQTNLLALNATIEAARAGDAGRGFAVVASEVKALASQTARATEEISSEISQMQSATADSVSAIGDIGATISRLSDISAGIAAAVDEQAAATNEIARSVQYAASGANTVAAGISQVNEGAVDTRATSLQVRASSSALNDQSKQLTEEVEKFLLAIRSA